MPVNDFCCYKTIVYIMSQITHTIKGNVLVEDLECFQLIDTYDKRVGTKMSEVGVRL